MLTKRAVMIIIYSLLAVIVVIIVIAILRGQTGGLSVSPVLKPVFG